MPFSRFHKARPAKESQLAVDDPRFACVADHPLDRFGRGDIYLVVPPHQWSRANEIVENLDEWVGRPILRSAAGLGHER